MPRWSHYGPIPRLSAENYPEIERAMLAEPVGLPSALLSIPSATSQPETSPASAGLYGSTPFDYRFSRQIQALTTDPAPPDMYFCTEKSAVPVADSIRGYYAATRGAKPTIHTIAANSLGAYSYWDTQRLRPQDRQEIERLETLIEAAGHIAVVEQCCASGNTLRFAAQLLCEAGLTARLTAVRGWWYEEASHCDIDLVNVTSSHASFMYDVGQQAAEQ